MPSGTPLVINTGPLPALFAATGNLAPLARLGRPVIVPFEVHNEILVGGADNFAVDLYRSETWLDRREMPTVLHTLVANAIDPGEAAVISLAMAEGISDVCLDDKEARHVARLCGLRVTGSLGVLIAAKTLGERIEIRDAAANMRRRGIWISDDLLLAVLQRAGE